MTPASELPGFPCINLRLLEAVGGLVTVGDEESFLDFFGPFGFGLVTAAAVCGDDVLLPPAGALMPIPFDRFRPACPLP